MARPEFDVFLSHAHEDAVWADRLAKRLIKQEKLNPWLDKWVIVPGT